MKVLSTLALVLLIPASTLSSADQIDPQVKLTDVRLAHVLDYHRALFSLQTDDLGLQEPIKEKLGQFASRFDWPADTSEEVSANSENGANGAGRNTLLMTLSGIGLIGFMSMRRRH